jgi:exosortase
VTNPDTKRFPYVRLAFVSLLIGMIFAQFHLFGNTTEVEGFGRSAFNWMLTLWKSGRIFGGNIYYLGWIMPLVTLVMIYRRRRDMARAVQAVYWPGLLIVMLAIFLHWAGARAQQTRLSLMALIMLLWAIPFFLYGWPLARQLIFPLGLLIFCVPLNFLDAFTFPMRVLSAAGAELLSAGLGLAVERAGSVIRLVDPAITLNGADPASGLGTLLILVAAALVAGAWRPDGWLLRIMLTALVVPFMMIAGSIRLLLGILAAKWISAPAALAFHDVGGLPVMLGLPFFALLLLRHRLVRLSWYARKE